MLGRVRQVSDRLRFLGDRRVVKRALGKIVAKSGTTIDGDLLNQEYLLLGKASAGYMTAKSGRDLVWAVYVNDVLSADLLDLIGVGADIGKIAEAIYEAN